MKNISISRLMRCKPLLNLVAFVTISMITISCNRRGAIILNKVVHDYEHAAEHHEGQNGTERWVVEQDSYEEQDSYNNSSANREGKLSVDGIAVDNNGYMSPLNSDYNWAIVTQDNLFFEHNMVRMNAYMNNESTVTVHINIFEIPVNSDDYPEYKTIDVSSYKFKSQDDLQTYYFNVYR